MDTRPKLNVKIMPSCHKKKHLFDLIYKLTLHEKCPKILARIFCIRTEYGDLLRKSPYSFRILENTDQKKLRIWSRLTQYN